MYTENKVNVKLDSIKAVKDFINITSQLPMQAFFQDASHNVDSKSIMGVLSLDLSKPNSLVIDADEHGCEQYVNAIRQFVVA
jgi:phosphotransferase system HPr-like phosphotransfer protein